MREQSEQDVAVKPVGTFPGRRICSSIATRNGSISWPYCTPEGQAVSQARQSRHNSKCRRTSVDQRQPAVGHRPHQIDAAARAVVLVAQFEIRRAGRRTQPAVDAVEKQLVVDPRAGRSRASAAAMVCGGVVHRRRRRRRSCDSAAGTSVGSVSMQIRQAWVEQALGVELFFHGAHQRRVRAHRTPHGLMRQLDARGTRINRSMATGLDRRRLQAARLARSSASAAENSVKLHVHDAIAGVGLKRAIGVQRTRGFTMNLRNAARQHAWSP